MNILVDLFRCFLIIFFAFSLKLRDSKVRGIQLQQHHYNWKKSNISGTTEREWTGDGDGETTSESAWVHTTTEGSNPRAFPEQSMQKPRTASEKKESQPRNQQEKPPDEASDRELAFRNLPQNDGGNSKPPGNIPPSRGKFQSMVNTQGSSNPESEKPNNSLSISIGWGPMIPQEMKKEHDNKFHRLMCLADCKLADLMVFNMENQSESNPFLNMPLPGRPYTYNSLIDWCKENCGNSYGWMTSESKPTTASTTVTTTTPTPASVRVTSYERDMPSFNPYNRKQSLHDYKHFEPTRYHHQPHFPPTIWQQPIYPTMPAHAILHFGSKPPIFRSVHSILPTIIIPQMAITKPNFFPFPKVMVGPPPPPPPPPQIMYHTRDNELGDDRREMMPSMNSPGSMGMNFRLKGPFFAGAILKRPLTGKSNMVPEEYDVGVDTRQWNKKGIHEQSVRPYTEKSHQTTMRMEEEHQYREEKEAIKEYEDPYRHEKDDESEDIATTILNLLRNAYKLLKTRGVRTLLNILLCDDESSASVKQHNEQG